MAHVSHHPRSVAEDPGHAGAESRVDHLLAEMGFDLCQVTWGYQEIFREAIVELHGTRLLGPGNPVVTHAFFDILRRSDKSTLDSVLKSFLQALGGEFRWLMRLPRLFERWAGTGLRLAEHRHFLGIRFFEDVGAGVLGTTPKELEFVLDVVGLLLEEQVELVGAFLQGYPYLTAHLSAECIRSFVSEAARIHARNPQTGRAYLACELESATRRVEQLTRQASVSGEKDVLERLTQALLGHSLTVGNLGELDVDELLIRGSSFVACHIAMYLPERLSEFGDRRTNVRALKALVCVGTGALASRSFASIHGTAGIETCRDIVPGDIAQREVFASLLYVTEVHRVLAYCRHHYPGLRGFLARFVSLEFASRPAITAADHFIAVLLGAGQPQEVEQVLRGIVVEVAASSTSVLHAVEGLSARWDVIIPCLSALDLSFPPRPLFFFPDPFFPLTVASCRGDQALVDLRDALRSRLSDADEEDRGDDREAGAREASDEARGDGEGDEELTSDEQAALVGYFYDEWNNHCCDYYRDWCCVHEQRPSPRPDRQSFCPELLGYAEHVRRIFERLRPEEMGEETRLLDGDSIGLDDFMEYVSQRDVKHNTEMRFYNKPLVRTRDIAIAILIDLSGSTAEPCGGQKAADGDGSRGHRGARFGIGELQHRSKGKTVVEVEKEAAFVLATGLATLGDAFAVFGFTGTGRESCQFMLVKSFDEDWSQDCVRGLLGTNPGSSTRIGAALRHAGWRLGQQPARTKVLLLISDGKPCDQGYDTANHYAQHDVRKACEENAAANIHTFCVSTSENTPADMEIMFPRSRYLILDDIARLPATLSRLYLQLTR